MFSYGSKLGGAIAAVAAAAGAMAGLLYWTSAPERAYWAFFLASGLTLAVLLGRLMLRHGEPTATSRPQPTPTTLEPGQIVPWDAVILEGESEIDDGALGGSVFAELKTAGAHLRRGARNGDGRLQIAPQGKAAPATPESQLDLAEIFPAAINRQAPRILMALLALAAAVTIKIDAPTALLAVAAAVPPGFGLIRAVVFDAARRKARQFGMHLDDVAVIDALAKIDTVALAPGGIVTSPDLSLLSLHPAPGFKPAELIAAATTCCQSSHSSLARAILRFAVAHGVRLRSIGDWRPDIGQGLVATTDLGAELALGERAWLLERGLPPTEFDAIDLPASAPGRRTAWIAELGPRMSVIGALILGDRLKLGAAELAKNLKRVGVETLLLDTGATEGQIDLARQLGLGRSLPDVGERQGLLLVDRAGAPPMQAEVQARAQAGLRLGFGMAQTRGGHGDRTGTIAEIQREDPRAILDLILLCRAARRREAIAALLAFAFCLPSLWYALGGRVAVEIVVLSPLLGLVAIAASAQFLHLFQPTASEVDDE